MASKKLILEKADDDGRCMQTFQSLPEGCIAAIISPTDPRDACRVACVSKIFKSAANSDAVWEHFLPSGYVEIIARSHQRYELLHNISRKELFFHLIAHPILIDDSTKCFSLESVSGKKCFTIGARGLVIIWADTPRYWTWHPAPDSKFPEVVELISVCWLEIRGTIRASLLSPDTNYAAYFVFKIADAAYGFHSPAELGIKTDCGKIETQTAYLYPDGESQRYQIYPRQDRVFNRIQATVARAQVAVRLDRTKQFPTQRRDGWLELEIGEFFISRDEVGDVEMSVMDVKNGNWKGGLMIEGIEIRPKMAMQ